MFLRFPAGILAFAFLIGVARGEPPPVGFRGPIAYPDGRVPDRIACDKFEQITAIYEAGKVIVYLMRPMADKIARENKNRFGEPACMIGRWGAATITDRKLLGPVKNPVGDADLVMWAVQVETSRGYRFWILVVDAPRDPKAGTI